MKKFFFVCMLACTALFCACQEDEYLPIESMVSSVKQQETQQHKVIVILDGDTLTGEDDTSLSTRTVKSINNATVSGLGSYAHGSSVTVTARPKSGYFLTKFEVKIGTATCTFANNLAQGVISSLTQDMVFHVETKPCPVITFRTYNGYLSCNESSGVSQHRLVWARADGNYDSSYPNNLWGMFPWRYTEMRCKDSTTVYSNTAGPTLKTTFSGCPHTTLSLSTNRGSSGVGAYGSIYPEDNDLLVVHNYAEVADYSMESWPKGTTVPFLMESENNTALTDKYYEADYNLTYYSPSAGAQERFATSVITDYIVYQCATNLVYNSTTQSYYVSDILPSTTNGSSTLSDYSEHYLYNDIAAGNSIDLKKMKLTLIDLRLRSQVGEFYMTTTKQADLEIDFSGLTWSSTYGCWYVVKAIPNGSKYVVVYVMQGGSRTTMRQMFAGKGSSSSSTWSKASGNQLYIAIRYTNSSTDINPLNNTKWYY